MLVSGSKNQQVQMHVGAIADQLTNSQQAVPQMTLQGLYALFLTNAT